MRRCICIAFVLTIGIFLSSAAIASDDVEYSQTTEQTINFRDIEWGIDDHSFVDLFKEEGNEIKATYSEYGTGKSYSASSTSYGDGNIVPIVSSKNVPTREYWIQREGFGFLCQVAGHNVWSIRAGFFEHASYAPSYPAGLYYINIGIADHKTITEIEQYNDLYNKLCTLYGTPYTYEHSGGSIVYGVSEYITSVWIGANNTSVYLRYSNNLKNDELDSVYITYGLSDSYTRFAQLDQEYALYLENQKNKQLDSMKDDYSGL